MKTSATNRIDNARRWASFNKVPAPAGWVTEVGAGGKNHTIFEIRIFWILFQSCFIWIEDFSRPFPEEIAEEFVESILQQQDFSVIKSETGPLDREILQRFELTQVGRQEPYILGAPGIYLSTAHNPAQLK